MIGVPNPPARSSRAGRDVPRLPGSARRWPSSPPKCSGSNARKVRQVARPRRPRGGRIAQRPAVAAKTSDSAGGRTWVRPVPEEISRRENPPLGASRHWQGRAVMKIVVIGGTGLIGSKTVAILRRGGHEVVAASPNTGVDTITGEGLEEAVAGAQVVVDLANSPSFEDRAVLEFFETSGRNLLAAEAAAGIRHHVALSIVGTDRTADNGYFRSVP